MAATRSRSRKSPLKGRALVAMGLALFIVVTMIVVARRSTGVRTVKEIGRLREEQRSLLAQQKTYENDLRRAKSRRAVVPEAERRLGMRRPTEAQTRFLTRPSAAPLPADTGADSSRGPSA